MIKVFLLTATLLAFVSSADATSFVTSRGALGATDFIDWAQLGPNTTAVSSPANVTSNLGASATVSNPGNFERGDQGIGWVGNFAYGDAVLCAFNSYAGPAGPMDIVFANPVFGAGAQIQAVFYGTFTGYLNVYGSDDVTLLASYTKSGTSNGNGDNSAIFMGASDTLADIGKIEFSVISDTGYGNDFGINRLDLNGTGAFPVPEPSTFALIGIGLAGFGLVRYKVRR